MNLFFNSAIAKNLTSQPQKIRRMSENWALQNLFCLRCNGELRHSKNNTPVCDLYCPTCLQEYELKSSHTGLGSRIIAGAYATMIKKIKAGKMPTFIYINYDKVNLFIKNIVAIPQQFFTKDVIIKRKQLSPTSRRPNWIGCAIDVKSIPRSGLIYIVRLGNIQDRNLIISEFNKTLFMRDISAINRGWTLDILKIIDSIGKNEFSLPDIYKYESKLKTIHPRNANIRPKIRQQLQFLRDYGYLDFVGSGIYKIK